MLNNKFLDKVIEQIISETRIIDDKLYTPFSLPIFLLFSFPFRLFYLFSFSSHCKDVYSLNKEETKYVWDKYKEEVTALMDKKELTHQEKG